MNVQIKIQSEGSVAVNVATLIEKTENIALIEIDTHTKRTRCIGEFSGPDGPGICLEATEYSVNETDLPEGTDICFPEFVGWRPFACSGGGRYTIRLCLVKESN